jgi:hypothetical protein
MTIEQFIDEKVEERKQFLNEEGHTNLDMMELRNAVIEDYIEHLNDILYSDIAIEEE